MKRQVICCFKPAAVSDFASVPPELPEKLAESGFEFHYFDSPSDFLERLPEAEIAIVSNFEVDWIPKAPRLKWVATYSAGKERIAETALQAAGIKVTFGHYHGKIMAETVMGMMLFTARGLGTAYRLQQTVQWCNKEVAEDLSILRDKNCVILGLGHIGLHVARLTKAFGMYNVGVKRTADGSCENVDQVVALSELDRVLPLADHLVVILPSVPETNNLIGTRELALMKPTASLYNIGRGNCLDEQALYQTVKDRKLRWACLDVFQTEPLAMNSPLRELDNILILPHISAFAPEYFPLYWDEFMNDFMAYQKNE